MNSRKKASYSQKTWSLAFSKQPPRILIVDVTLPFWRHICSNVCEALANFFSLACSLAGPCRLPLLSMYMVHNQHECLLPFLQVKGNFPRLHSCVTELRLMPKEGCIRQTPEVFKHAIEDSVLQYKQYMCHVSAGGSINSCSVEITLLTSQPGKQIVKQLKEGLQDTDLVSLRKLQVVHLSNTSTHPLMDMNWSPPILSGEVEDTDVSSILGSEIELQTLENDEQTLESFFKAWLHDNNSDREHLHLLLPPALQDGRHSSTCLKCDIQERLLSPSLLQEATDFTLRTERIGNIYQSNKGYLLRQSVTQLRIIKAVKLEGVCESVFFGLPVVIRPTNCWQLDWEELELNQQNFHALAYIMKMQDWLLLARCDTQGMVQSWNGPVYTYYILQPSTSLTLLMKPIAVRELILPCHLPVVDQDPPEHILSKIQSSLDTLEVDLAYNPLSVKSNLYKHLQNILIRTPHKQQPRTRDSRIAQQASARQVCIYIKH
uniref:Meiosis 1 arrest protein n=1 Tax=Erpetoichthys calabaricus TaxID=27687 RepID=A0A8C4RRD0_ERPCA